MFPTLSVNVKHPLMKLWGNHEDSVVFARSGTSYFDIDNYHTVHFLG